jgi:hypothetical protein
MNSIEYKDKKQSLILQISKHLCLIHAKIIIYSKFIRNDDKNKINTQINLKKKIKKKHMFLFMIKR